MIRESLEVATKTVQHSKLNFNNSIAIKQSNFQFLLRQAVADDEASTRLLNADPSVPVVVHGPPLLSCSFLVPLGLLSHCPSTSLVVFLCFLFPALIRTALLPEVCFPPSLLCAQTTSAFFF